MMQCTEEHQADQHMCMKGKTTKSHMDITGLSDRMWKRPIAFWKCLFVMVCAMLSLENILKFFKQHPSLHQLVIYYIFHLLVPMPFPVNETQMCVPKKNTTCLICKWSKQQLLSRFICKQIGGITYIILKLILILKRIDHKILSRIISKQSNNNHTAKVIRNHLSKMIWTASLPCDLT